MPLNNRSVSDSRPGQYVRHPNKQLLLFRVLYFYPVVSSVTFEFGTLIRAKPAVMTIPFTSF